MRKILIYLLIITFTSVLFMGCTKKNINNNTKSQSTKDSIYLNMPLRFWRGFNESMQICCKFDAIASNEQG